MSTTEPTRRVSSFAIFFPHASAMPPCALTQPAPGRAGAYVAARAATTSRPARRAAKLRLKTSSVTRRRPSKRCCRAPCAAPRLRRWRAARRSPRGRATRCRSPSSCAVARIRPRCSAGRWALGNALGAAYVPWHVGSARGSASAHRDGAGGGSALSAAPLRSAAADPRLPPPL